MRERARLELRLGEVDGWGGHERRQGTSRRSRWDPSLSFCSLMRRRPASAKWLGRGWGGGFIYRALRGPLSHQEPLSSLIQLPLEMRLLLSPSGKPEGDGMATLGTGHWMLPTQGCRPMPLPVNYEEVFLSRLGL